MTMPRVQDLVSSLLDRGYDRAASTTLDAISARSTSGIVAQRMSELKTEAARLEKEGQKLTSDNPILRAALADVEDMMVLNTRDMRNASPGIQATAITAADQLAPRLILPALTQDQLSSIGVAWNTPDPEAVNSLVGYSTSEAWRAELADYGLSVPRRVRELVVEGIVRGRGPLATARLIEDTVVGMPLYRANTLARTIQLQSYRDATAIHQRANADILDGAIRVGVLDSRICLCCLAEHGKKLAVGERVSDHHNGRCMAVSLVKGFNITVQTGSEWFAAQPPDTQYEIAGASKLEALTTGRAQLEDFVQPYDDAVFGEMLREATLSEALKRRS